MKDLEHQSVDVFLVFLCQVDPNIASVTLVPLTDVALINAHIYICNNVNDCIGVQEL